MRWAIVDGKRVPGVKQADGTVVPIPAKEPKKQPPAKAKPDKKKE